jgi:hypothetical protein
VQSSDAALEPDTADTTARNNAARTAVGTIEDYLFTLNNHILQLLQGLDLYENIKKH